VDNPWIAAARFLGIGWFIVICVGGGALGGRWIGQQLGYEAVFTLVGVCLGLTLAGFGVYESYLTIKKSQEKDNGKKEK
jgi:hypothetical protein